MLKIYNAISKKKETFKSIKNNEVSIYVCGVTVYDLCHIGHARTFLVFDVIIRYLRYIGYNVKYVRNITDIDDKIIKKAHAQGERVEIITKYMIDAMHQDLLSLDILPPDIEPKVTDHINDIIKLISRLIDLGHAYLSVNGDVMFNVKSYSKYGDLSHQKLEKLNFDTDVNKNILKQEPTDFVLWKKAKLYEPAWDSYWGKGRPGWHIECSAMSHKYLGKHFDIHGGGIDLKFPHHENEKAQSVCVHKSPYVNYWIHSGMVMINSEKMSKSLNNCSTIRDVLKIYNPETLRYFLLSKHYGSPLLYNDDKINVCDKSLRNLYVAIYNTDYNIVSLNNNDECKEFERRFCLAMDDNFNIPKACSILFSMARKINYLKTSNNYLSSLLAAKLIKLANIIGILQKDPETFLKNAKKIHFQYSSLEITNLIKKRNEYRLAKNWKKADIIRDKLQKLGVILEDGLKGTKWYYK